MTIYRFRQVLKLNDVDPTFAERHYVDADRPRILRVNHIHKLQERLYELGFGYMVGNINGCFNRKLHATILTFQEQAKSKRRRIVDQFTGVSTFVDVELTYKGEVNGEVDEYTVQEFNYWLVSGFINSADEPLVQFGRTYVRPRVASLLLVIQGELQELGGAFPEFGIASFRHPANVTRGIGMKPQSLHHAALALDFDEWRGMQDPKTDRFFLVARDQEDGWEVLVRSQDERLAQQNIKASFYDHVRRAFYTAAVEGRFINLSDIMIRNGFRAILPRTGWQHEYYLSEWWHFELSPQGTWNEEMRAIGFTEKVLFVFGYV